MNGIFTIIIFWKKTTPIFSLMTLLHHMKRTSIRKDMSRECLAISNMSLQ